MSVFEAIMLICFGAAWPFSIYQSLKTRSNGGKSAVFLYIVLAGYAAGIVHKLQFDFDVVIWLYAANAVMVIIDIGLFHRNASLTRTPPSVNT